MDPHRRPGPERVRRASPRVYRRRRLVVGILALLIAGGMVWAASALAAVLVPGIGVPGIGQAASTGTTAAPSVPPAVASSTAAPATATPAPPTESPTAAATPACDPAKVVVTASTDAEVYAAEQNPVLTLTVSNTGKAACSVNVGTTQMEFLITSGEDRIFSSVDCQAGAKDLQKDIPPGGSEKANFTWERIRSAPGCNPVEVRPGPGFYNLATKLGERISKRDVFELE